MSRRRSTGRAVCAAVALSAGAVGTAHAAELEPLLDTSIVNRVHDLVPLNPNGATIALNATSREPGRQVGPGSYLARNGIYLADRDGSGLRVAWAAREGEAISHPTATPDGAHLAFVVGALAGDPQILDMATLRLRAVRGPDSSFVDGFLAGPRLLYATGLDGRALSVVDKTTAVLKPVRIAGPAGPRGRPGIFTYSRSGTRAGLCGALRGGRPGAGLRLGLLDSDKGLVRAIAADRRARSTTYTDANASNELTCAVSDDGSTVATLGTRGGATRLYVLRGGGVRVIRVPHAAVHVAAISPSGRRVLIGGGSEEGENRYGKRRIVPVSRVIAAVDVDTGKVSPARDVQTYLKRRKGVTPTIDGGRAVWSSDEQHIGLAPSSGGVMVVDSATAAVRFTRSPLPPVGFAFSGPAAQPVAFSEDGNRLIFTVSDKSQDITVLHPFSIPIEGSARPTYLLTPSMRSYSQAVRSADGATTWVLPSSTCHSVYPQPLLRLSVGALWDGPLRTAPEVAPEPAA